MMLNDLRYAWLESKRGVGREEREEEREREGGRKKEGRREGEGGRDRKKESKHLRDYGLRSFQS